MSTLEIAKLVPPDIRDKLGTLSVRELEIFEAIGSGQANHTIADALGISTKTVDTHRGNLLKKLAPSVTCNADIGRWLVLAKIDAILWPLEPTGGAKVPPITERSEFQR